VHRGFIYDDSSDTYKVSKILFLFSSLDLELVELQFQYLVIHDYHIQFVLHF